MVHLVTPPRVFIDTCHLSGMLDAQRGGAASNDPDGSRMGAYQTLNSWVRNGVCSPVWCELLVAEWIRHKDAGRARKYARILDTAPQAFEFDPGAAVAQAECLNECRRIRPELEIPRFEIVRPIAIMKPLLEFMKQHHPDWNEVASTIALKMPPGPPPLEWSVRTVGLTVEAYIGLSPMNAKAREVGEKGDKFAFDTTKNTQQSCSPKKIFSDATIKYWILNALQLKDLLISVDPTCDPEGITDQIDLQNCPGLFFYYRLYNKFVRSKDEYDDPHDLIDHAFIPGLWYCDHALVDKRVRNLVEEVQRDGVGHRVEAASDPRRFVTAVSARLGDRVV